jgi:DNA-binding Lrp family transcriptional regulator
MINKEYLALLLSFEVNGAKFFPYYVYYTAIKLKPGTTAAEKAAFTNKIRDNKIFCTSYETSGDFDYWAGYHVESWESWYKNMRPVFEDDIVESYTLLPSSAQVRHGMLNAYAVPEKAMECDVAYPSNFDALPAVTNGKMTSEDVKIIKAWNKKLPVEKQLNWKKIAKISGKSEKDLISLLAGLRDSKIVLGPFWAFNWKALGVNRHFFFVELKNATIDSRRVAMVSDFARANDFNLVYYHSDSLIKFTLIAPEGLADLEQCRNKIKSICGDSLVKIHEAEEVQQLRWWTRLWYTEKFNQPGGVYLYKDK